MRARPSSLHALIVGGLLLAASPATAEQHPEASKNPASTPSTEKAESPASGPATPSKPPAINPATPADVARERLSIEVRHKELSAPEVKGRPTTKPIIELLAERKRLLVEWEKLSRERAAAEKPSTSPEDEATGFKSERDKDKALLDQLAKSPDALLPEAFQSAAADAVAANSEPRLSEMKEAIDAARNELKERNAELEGLRSEGTRKQTERVAADRAERDKVHQRFVALVAARGEREASVTDASSPEARAVAGERLANLEWEGRVEAERLAAIEARIALAGKRLELETFRIQALSARVQLARKVLQRMEERYSSQAERQRSDLKQAVAKEETRAAHSDDPLVRQRAKKTADLLELESQVLAHEKTYATSGVVSLQEQVALADSAVAAYADLRKVLDDNEISPLDALRLKNDFRRIGPERAQIVRTDLAAALAERIAYENSLTDAEIDLINDSRDDRYERDSFLEKLPQERRAEGSAMLEELETRHRGLLNRRRNVLQKLASRAEETHKQVARRIDTLDQEYAFIRAHIFWIRDAEPLGVATVAHARDESIRTARALIRLAAEGADRSLWGHVSVEFSLAVLAMVALPLPLRIGRKAIDRVRLGDGPEDDANPSDTTHG